MRKILVAGLGLIAANVATNLGAQAARRVTPASEAVQGVGSVIPGIEVLIRDSLHLIRGKRVGLITNHCYIVG